MRIIVERLYGSPFSHQRGFTLIELVMVIVIIGILAAAAIPKFANLTSQAQVAANRGFAGALTEGVAIAHAAWIANGSPTSGGSGGTVTLDGNSVSVNYEGWPDGGAGGGAPTTTQCATIAQAILNTSVTVVPYVNGASDCNGYSNCYSTGPNGNQCEYIYYPNGTTPS